jgi:hypothetical protein
VNFRISFRQKIGGRLQTVEYAARSGKVCIDSLNNRGRKRTTDG